MEKVVGVRFRNVGKIYYFNPKNYKVKVGDHVIVETARGVEYGRVVLEPRSVKEDEVVHPLKEVLRVATKEDEDHEAENRQKEKEAFKICKKKIREHGLDMKLIDAEYTFDNNKVLFYFTADGRIDFRQLVKDLASVFKTRIELRQIGVRDETKILGGIGICGRTPVSYTHLDVYKRQIEIRGIKIDKTARRVWVNGEETTFTTKEFDLLTFLAENPNRVFTKEELFREIWDMESVGDIATVTVHIKKIREKIEFNTAKPQYIETIWGVGYRFKV